MFNFAIYFIFSFILLQIFFLFSIDFFISNLYFTDMRKIFPFELFHLGGDEVNTG